MNRDTRITLRSDIQALQFDESGDLITSGETGGRISLRSHKLKEGSCSLIHEKGNLLWAESSVCQGPSEAVKSEQRITVALPIDLEHIILGYGS